MGKPHFGRLGLGWEVWCDGMEVTQYTYFQQMGGFDCKPVAGELTYGLERLAMYIQGVDSVYDLVFNDAVGNRPAVTYGDVFLENEREMSKWNFEVADTDKLFRWFKDCEEECAASIAANVPLAAYYGRPSRRAISSTCCRRAASSACRSGPAIIGRVRELAKGAARPG